MYGVTGELWHNVNALVVIVAHILNHNLHQGKNLVQDFESLPPGGYWKKPEEEACAITNLKPHAKVARKARGSHSMANCDRFRAYSFRGTRVQIPPPAPPFNSIPFWRLIFAYFPRISFFISSISSLEMKPLSNISFSSFSLANLSSPPAPMFDLLTTLSLMIVSRSST